MALQQPLHLRKREVGVQVVAAVPSGLRDGVGAPRCRLGQECALWMDLWSLAGASVWEVS